MRYWTIKFVEKDRSESECHFVGTEDDAMQTIQWYCDNLPIRTGYIAAVDDTMPSSWLEDEGEEEYLRHLGYEEECA